MFSSRLSSFLWGRDGVGLALSVGVAAFSDDSRVLGDDSPSSCAPPLGDTVAVGLPLAPLSSRVEGLDGAAVADPTAGGFAITGESGLGDVPPGVGRGETVAAGDAVMVCAPTGIIEAPRRRKRTAAKSNVFMTNRDLLQPDKNSTNGNRHTSWLLM